jgi:hypothetical protein
MGKAKEQAQLQNRASLRQYNQSMKEFAAQKADLQREVDLTNKIQEETFTYQQELRNLERLSILDQYERSQDQYRQQLVFNQQAVDSAIASQNRVYMERIADARQQAEDNRLSLAQERSRSQYNLDQSEFSLAQALYNTEANKVAARQDYESQLLTIESERNSINKSTELRALEMLNIENRERDAIADRNFESLTTQVEAILQEGAARSLGRTGVSAENTLQSLTASFAFNSAKVADALYRSQEALDIERKGVEVEIESLEKQGLTLNKRQDLTLKGYGLQLDRIRKEASFAKEKTRIDVGRIREELGFSEDIFTMNQQRIGESLISAASARQYAIQQIARGKVQADLQADAVRMLPPRFAPDPPRPYKAEMPTLVPPPEPIQVKREAFQLPQPKKQSGASKVLAIGGAVLGIAGAVFTAGSSLALAGAGATAATKGIFGMTAGALGATGIGLSAAGQGLGLISQYTY